MKLKKSPLAPEKFPILPSIRGVNIGTSVSNSKYKRRQDILTITFDKPASVAGVFTLSQMPAAPVEFCKKNIANGYATALIVNAGIANSFTGKKGTENNRIIANYNNSDYGRLSILANWKLIIKGMRKPSWIFDTRGLISKETLKDLEINFWSLGNGCK